MRVWRKYLVSDKDGVRLERQDELEDVYSIHIESESGDEISVRDDSSSGGLILRAEGGVVVIRPMVSNAVIVRSMGFNKEQECFGKKEEEDGEEVSEASTG